ncbi:peptidase inhibitor 16-like isoform X2 [Syngnathoides biaculeatus]|uniref:peptidase inhibitor 16-like isoform X2 n=1 Tax=Syngnathoides biaculeatus TaxID=300417 RepID=UPI002ADE8081|nr:peptidase inhibitor 16-like isoform X2 [Syngnathoides biaculeatus]
MRQQGTLGLHMDSEVPARGEHVTNCSRARGVPLMKWLLLATLLAPGTWSLLNEEEEELLVELHNYYRGQVFPSASAMLPLKWDPTLKLLAEGYAAKCIWNHNPDLEDTGENLYAGTGPVDLRAALEKWFLEHLSYDFQNNSCDDDKMCGHYTQMVWSDTHRVGCAVHLCNNMEGLEWEKISFLVCNYYPAGNYEDERPYVEGDSCSQCPEKLQTCENNLCVPDMDDKDGEEEDEEEEKKQKEEELYHQVDVTGSTSRSIPSTQTPTTVQRKAAIRKEVDSKARQQETRMECEPVFTISQKDIPPMTSATSSPSPPPFILLFLSFILIIIMLPLCGRG